MYHIFFINPSVDGHLWYFYVLSIAKNVAMKTGVHVFFLNHGLSGFMPRCRISGL